VFLMRRWLGILAVVIMTACGVSEDTTAPETTTTAASSTTQATTTTQPTSTTAASTSTTQATTTTTQATSTTAASTSTTQATTTTAPAGASLSINIAGFRFTGDQTGTIGDTVTITNGDAVGHTWTSTEGAFHSGVLGGGETFTFTFEQAGTYSYFCQIHPEMTGSITIGS
jgi:plastocyanin